MLDQPAPDQPKDQVPSADPLDVAPAAAPESDAGCPSPIGTGMLPEKAADPRMRRRLMVALKAAWLSLMVSAGAGAAWWWQQRPEKVPDVDAVLAEAEALYAKGDV